jgi:putative DNA primase/helicase
LIDLDKIDKIIKYLQRINASERYPLTDLGSRQLFADLLKNVSRYNVTKKDFMFYENGVWQRDYEGLKTANLIADIALALSMYGRGLENPDTYTKHYNKWLDNTQRPRLQKDIRSVYQCCDDDFDKDVNILNCKNKTLRLNNDGTVEVLEHSSKLMLTKQANVIYEPDVVSQLWLDTYTDIMQSDKPNMRYLQKLLGYSCTGYTEIEKMWLLYGSTSRNGKSTLLETIVHMLGNYAVAIKAEALAERVNADGRSANPEVIKLKGAYLAIAPEPEKGMSLNGGMTKQLTGGDTFSARALYQEETSFKPRCKLLMNCNYLPIISDMTLFESDRMCVIPFTKHYAENERDTTLKTRLVQPQELTGILNWCLTGWQMYRQEGLSPSDSIKIAVSNYRQGNDKYQNFLDDCFFSSTGNNVSIKVAYEVYEKWCSSNGYSIENKTSFSNEIKNRNMYKASGTIRGKTVRNIIPNIDIISEWQPAPITPFKGRATCAK